MLLQLWNFWLCVFRSLANGLQEYNTNVAQCKFLREENAKLRLNNIDLQERVAATASPKRLTASTDELEKFKKEVQDLRAQLEAQKSSTVPVDKFEKTRKKLVAMSATIQELKKQLSDAQKITPQGVIETMGN